MNDTQRHTTKREAKEQRRQLKRTVRKLTRQMYKTMSPEAILGMLATGGGDFVDDYTTESKRGNFRKRAKRRDVEKLQRLFDAASKLR